MIELIWDAGFKRAYKKRIAPDPELKDRFWSALDLFVSDPFAHVLPQLARDFQKTLARELGVCRAGVW